jgi:excinuclease ABC subunit C
MATDKIEQILPTLPGKPGVYLYKNVQGKVIYVGKAVNLKNRVRSYFHKSAGQTSPKTCRLVEEIADIEFIVAESELEALLLENTLIKKYQPRYNVRLKDDKRYPYIKVHWQDDYPRVTTTRHLQNDGARYFGPYTAAWAAYQTLDLVRKIFPYLTCTRTIDGQDERACLYYYIGRCAAPCVGAVNQAEYRQIIDNLCDFLSGHTEPVVADLRRQMETAAENLDFEKAAQLRDQMKTIDQVVEKQKVVNAEMLDEDVIAFARANGDACVQVFFIRGGKLVGRDYFVLEGATDGDDAEIMSSFLKQFYDQAATIPPEIVLPEEIDELMIIRDWLRGKRGAEVTLNVPRQGQQKELLDMVAQNAAETLTHLRARWAADESKQTEGLAELQQVLNLAEPPLRIECYDISTLQGTHTVGSMVVFEKGVPQKSDYRRFKIQSVSGQDDFASMQEMLRRRFKRMSGQQKLEDGGLKIEDGGVSLGGIGLKAEEKNAWARLPDLIVIDGGKGQLNAALEVLDQFEMRDAIAIIGLAKREEEVFLPGHSESLLLPRTSQGLYLLQRIRDEAHRFGLTYHRQLRGQGAVRSSLDEVEGIGPKRRKALLQKFGSLEAIRQASLEELAAVPGMNRAAAQRLKEEL